MLLDGITLPNTLRWTNEFDWSPVVQSSGYGVTGALFIQEGVKLQGREIILAGTETLGWVTREIVSSLITSRNTANHQFTVTLPDARVLTVRWQNSDKAVDVTPIVEHNQYAAGGFYKINALRLIQVA